MLKENILVAYSAPSAFVVNVIGGGLYLFFHHLLSQLSSAEMVEHGEYKH